MFNPLFDTAEYLSLSTKKRDGSTVETPVWFAKKDNTLYLFSEGNAGKIKRLKNFPQTRVAICDIRGKIKSEWISTEGRILSDDADINMALSSLHHKYGWKMKLLDFFSRVAGKIKKRGFIAITNI